MAAEFRFDPISLPASAVALREDVRAFLRAEIAAGTFTPGLAAYCMHTGDDPDFSRKVGARGWIGITWPRQYGGQARSALDRFVATEEFLAVGAPVRAHWSADRQYGPLFLRHGTEAQRRHFLPLIARGECFFCIGLSEPNSGSDLFSVQTRATRVDGGWRINGRKIWTSHAHSSHYMVALVRTAPATQQDRRHGLTQFVVDMASPGIAVRPIQAMTGERPFNEVLLDDVFVPETGLIGEADKAWMQASGELAHERAGPERFMETFQSFVGLLRIVGSQPDERTAEGIGRQAAHLATLRRMSLSIAGMLATGKVPAAEAAVVKDLGTNFEQALPSRVRELMPHGAVPSAEFEAIQRFNMLNAPNFTIGGGTREVLRGIIARGLGLR